MTKVEKNSNLSTVQLFRLASEISGKSAFVDEIAKSCTIYYTRQKIRGNCSEIKKDYNNRQCCNYNH